MRTLIRLILILIFIQLPFLSVAQKKSFYLPNEFGLSVNQTGLFLADGNAYGFSLTAYHSGPDNKRVSWVYGIELNSINIYTNYIRLDRWYSYQDLFISSYSASIPLLIRIGFTSDKNKLKLFGESGVRFDYKIWTHQKALYDFYSYTESVPSSSSYVEGPADKTTTPFTILPSVGAGLSFGLNKLDLILKTDYRLGELLYKPRNLRLIGYLNLSFQLRFNRK